MEIPKKLKVGEMRKEIAEHKKHLSKNVAVMRSDDLRKYLDQLRYASNAIEAEDALGKSEPTFKTEYKHDLEREAHLKREMKGQEHPTKVTAEILTDSDSEKEEKKAFKKVVKKVKEVEKEMKHEKKLNPKEHKAEKKHLEEIPKELKSMVKKHMKEHPDHSEKKALGIVKKALFKVLS